MARASRKVSSGSREACAERLKRCDNVQLQACKDTELPVACSATESYLRQMSEPTERGAELRTDASGSGYESRRGGLALPPPTRRIVVT
jgi:hypothetical protein